MHCKQLENPGHPGATLCLVLKGLSQGMLATAASLSVTALPCLILYCIK